MMEALYFTAFLLKKYIYIQKSKSVVKYTAD